MNEQELEARAVAEIRRRIEEDGPAEPVVLHEDGEAEWVKGFLRTVSTHFLHVLERGGDIVVFFDAEGRVTGWRDDGRRGAERPPWIDRDAFLAAVVAELGLPPTTRLGKLEPVELPPLGWTHQAVLFLAPVPSESEVIRIWASPENLRVIQCLYGPRPQKGGPR